MCYYSDYFEAAKVGKKIEVKSEKVRK